MLVFVAPYVGAWIETSNSPSLFCRQPVAPYVGAWIETFGRARRSGYFASHPTWVRGLKLNLFCVLVFAAQVAPYVGAWIETQTTRRDEREQQVAPYVGAWIETAVLKDTSEDFKSHPTWVRGLKLVHLNSKLCV